MSCVDVGALESNLTTRRRQAFILLGLNALYVGFGMIMGMVNGGLPTILRGQGGQISSAGWVYIFYLPFGLTFLWAPLIDRLRFPVLPQRQGWIVAMQLIAVVGLVCVALNQTASLWVLFSLGFVVVFAIATMDIALDAFAVRIIAPNWRSVASASKLAALSFGTMIGGGVLVALYGKIGWQGSFLLLAVSLLFLLCPVLLLGKYEEFALTVQALVKQEGPASLVRLFRNQETRKRLFVLTLVCCVMFPLVGLNRLMLIDLGVPVSTIGWVVGTLGPISMLATSVLSVPLMHFLGRRNAMLVFAGLAAASIIAMLFGFEYTNRLVAITGAVLIGAGVSGVYITIAAEILGWAVGTQPATDYAAHYGISRFASTLMTVAAAQIVPLLNWGIFYGAGAIAFLVMAFLLAAFLEAKTSVSSQ